MKNIREILSSRRVFGGIKIENLMILDCVWKKEMKDFSSYCDVHSIEGRILFVKVASSVVRNEMYIKKDEIIKRINKHFNYNFIKDIKFI